MNVLIWLAFAMLVKNVIPRRKEVSIVVYYWTITTVILFGGIFALHRV